MPKLRYLVNLEYLMLGHAEFSDASEFASFLKVISSENLPKLQYLKYLMHLFFFSFKMGTFTVSDDARAKS
ncbi:unnamed protein product [Gongylonema pulchrum]|uniref:Ovule protein n=1 Tax=Gongylonema pulchrum TaxID=637853 RepID=A0A183DFM7_9BILA|nr:unnamed protein product [Gongylonema pulchrum]